jgi:hypothetical protein
MGSKPWEERDENGNRKDAAEKWESAIENWKKAVQSMEKSLAAWGPA